MDDTTKELEELRARIGALTVFTANLLETLMQNGHLTYDQIKKICHRSDMRISYISGCLQGDIPDAATKRIEQLATDFILKLMDDVKPRY